MDSEKGKAGCRTECTLWPVFIRQKGDIYVSGGQTPKIGWWLALEIEIVNSFNFVPFAGEHVIIFFFFPAGNVSLCVNSQNQNVEEIQNLRDQCFSGMLRVYSEWRRPKVGCRGEDSLLPASLWHIILRQMRVQWPTMLVGPGLRDFPARRNLNTKLLLKYTHTGLCKETWKPVDSQARTCQPAQPS